jgi:putative colanic acid biosynthesis acetyltransferase WcaB
MSLFAWIFQDWDANRTRPDSQVILASFRLVQYLHQSAPLLESLVKIPYWIVVSVIIGVELPPSLTIGPRIRLYHPHNIVIHRNALIGSDCVIRHGVTIGTTVLGNGDESGAPRLHDNIELGAACILIGDIEIFDNCIIGARAVVTKSLPPGAAAVGNPFRIIRSWRDDNELPNAR